MEAGDVVKSHKLPQQKPFVMKSVSSRGKTDRYYLHHLCVRVQSEQFQASFTPHFGLNISGSLLKIKQKSDSTSPNSLIFKKKHNDPTVHIRELSWIQY